MKRTYLHTITNTHESKIEESQNESCEFHPAIRKTNYFRMKRYLIFALMLLFVHVSYAQKYGVYTEDESFTEKVDVDGGAATLKNISAFDIVVSSDNVYEGSKAIQITYNFSATWAMMQILANPTINLSDYANGFYNFAMKTTSTEPFNIRITDGTNKPKIEFAQGADPYGFQRDGEWHMVTIPISDFIAKAPALNLASISELFVVRSSAAALTEASSLSIEVDNIYFSKTASNEDVVSSTLFSPIPGEYTEMVWVKLACSTEGAVIHYTLDGTDPTALSAVFADSIQITENKIVKAIAIKNNVSSTVTSGSYTIKAPVQVTNTYAIYTQDPEISVGTSILTQPNNLFVISTITEGTYEGTEALRFSTDISKDWAMASVKPVTTTVDISAYANGYYNLAVKSTSDGAIDFQLRSAGQKAFISFDVVSEKYGFKRDGEWHFISIPIADFKANNANIDLTKVTDILVLRSGSDPRLSNNYDFELDHLYLSLTLPNPVVETVATPVISPVGGSFTTPVTVSISSATSGAKIYYTLDGSVPSSVSTLYAGSFILSETKTVKAVAIKDEIASNVKAETYTITIPAEVIAAPVFAPVAGNYSDSVNVTIVTTTVGAIIYYTVDGAEPTIASTVYNGAFKLTNTATVKAIAVKGGASSSVSSAIFNISNTIPVETVEAPVISPNGGVYADSVLVEIGCSTEGATIYYTLDGSLPTNLSTVYTEGFKLTESATVKTVAINNTRISNVSSATFTVNPSVLVDQTFAIYTQDNSIAPGVEILSQTNNLFVIGTTSTGTYEGDVAMSFTTDMSKDWAMVSLKPATPTVDISAFANGYYNFAIKSSSNGTILVRLQSSGQKGIITFDATSDKYGFKRDGGWHLVSIPIADFLANNPNLDLAAITDLMVLRSDSDIRLFNNYDFCIDHFYLSLMKPSTTETVEAPVITPIGGNHTTAVLVSINSATIGATVYFTIDGSEPTTSSQICAGSFELATSATVKAVAVKNENVSSISETAFVIEIATEPVIAPTFSVASGEYIDSVMVGISSLTEGALIYYTLDGTEPTVNSMLYTNQLKLEQNTTVKAITVKDGKLSEVSIAVYTIKLGSSIGGLTSQAIKVYPNPATHSIIISSEEKGFASIYNQSGQLLMNKLVLNSAVDVSKLKSGIYVVSINGENRNSWQKFIKR